MSIKVMSLVWDKSAHKDTPLLLLLAIADYADEDGYAWPSIETLQKKIRVDSPRTVHYNLKKLVDSGELSIDKTKGGRCNTHGFQINLSALNGAKAIAGFKKQKTLQSDAQTLQPVAQNPAIAFAPEPSLTVIEPSLAADAAKVSIADATKPQPQNNTSRTDEGIMDFLDIAFTRMEKQAANPAAKSENTIRDWHLPAHLEAICIEFVRLSRMPVKRDDKGQWAKGASWINEIGGAAVMANALKKGKSDGLTLTWPGALVELCRGELGAVAVEQVTAAEPPMITIRTPTGMARVTADKREAALAKGYEVIG